MSRFAELLEEGAEEILEEDLGDPLSYLHSDGSVTDTTALEIDVSDDMSSELQIGAMSTRGRSSLLLRVAKSKIPVIEEKQDNVLWKGKRYNVARVLQDKGFWKLLCF